MLRASALSRRKALSVVKELDAFPKVPESYQETSAARGGFSIVIFILILLLVMSEINYYTHTELSFDYVVDKNFTGKLKLNFDITVAMQCHHIGADVLDQTGQDVLGYGLLKQDPVFWELSPKQRSYQEFVQGMNSYFNEEYHAIQEILWRSGSPTFHGGMPPREGEAPDKPFDACRIHGTLEVNKVAGNFHIIAGKSVPVFPRGHAHLAMMMDQNDYNFSHRIDHLSFGVPISGVIYPLDGSEVTTTYHLHNFQYFMQVVPTEVRTYRTNTDTYQFAVEEKNRPINHAAGSHGMPGIYIKYDLSPLMIRVKEQHKPYWAFLVRICGIIGGVFTVSGMLNGLIGLLSDVVCCRFKLGRYNSNKDTKDSNINVEVSAKSPLLSSTDVNSVSEFNNTNLNGSQQFENISLLPQS